MDLTGGVRLPCSLLTTSKTPGIWEVQVVLGPVLALNLETRTAALKVQVS